MEEIKTYTRFEKARIIGSRALQLARGAPAMIKTDFKDPIKIAELELASGIVPMDVKRKLPPRI